MSEVQFVGPYDRDKCHFCGKSDKTHPTEDSHNVAGFGRTHDGVVYDACQKCAKAAEFPNFNDLRAQMSPDARARSEAKAQVILNEMALRNIA